MQGSPPRQHPPVDDTIPDFNDADDCRNEPEHVHNEPRELDDIQVEHHPHSQLPSTIHRFAEFSRSRPTEEHTPRNNSPWEPFRTRLDFEVAEIALEAAMTKDQTNRLLDLFHRSATGNDSFTLHNHDEVRSLWDLASQRYTRVSIPSYATTNIIIN